MEFKKATLKEVPAKASSAPENPKNGEVSIVVQINPATLRLTMANNVEMGKSLDWAHAQYRGSSSMLAFDLVFDTADEGTTEEPVDVRTRTRQLERFMLPNKDTAKGVPPRVEFSYGGLTVVGVMTGLNIEFDFFAVSGVPLRAKCSVTIKEQKPEFIANSAGPGANTGAGATPPVPPTGAGITPGSPGGPPVPMGPDARTGTALDGESASDFAHRMGIDPRAWKGLAASITDPLRLAAGQQIDFGTGLSLDPGLGVQRGPVAGLGKTGATGGARADTPADRGPVPVRPPDAGADLTARGGLSRALDRASVVRTEAAVAGTRAAFDDPSAGSSVTASAPAPPAVGRPGPSPKAAVQTADPRATSYGFSVPLRPRRGVASTSTVGLVRERARAAVQADADGLPETDDPTIPRWRAAPAGASPIDPGARRRGRATEAGGSRCGCGGGCGCRGGGGSR